MKATVYDEEGRTSQVPQLSASEVGETIPSQARAKAKVGSAKWRVTALLLLSAIPLAFGAVRLTQLASGAAITPANARFFAVPLPVVLHILSAFVYAIFGPFQFASRFRRRWPGWHRRAG